MMSPQSSPRRRVALVTGGSRGIGAAIAERLTRTGMDVHFTYRVDRDAAETVAKRISTDDTGRRAHELDVTDERAAERVVEDVVHCSGALDVLVNNAGVVDDALVLKTVLPQWEGVLRTNLTGPFILSRAVLPQMLMDGWGRIINISSSSAAVPGPGQAAYSASKGGLESLTRALAAEVGHKGIRVNSVAPGRIRTDMTEELAAGPTSALGRWGEPEDIAGLVDFLAGDDADYIQGQNFLLDGGRFAMRKTAERSAAGSAGGRR